MLQGHLDWEEQDHLEAVQMAVHGEEAHLGVPQASATGTKWEVVFDWAGIQGCQEASMESLMTTDPLEGLFREGCVRDCP